MSAGVPAVEFRGVRKRFGPTRALDGVDLEVARGEVVALLGPNGAGKTTAVSLMLGLREPTEGRVRILGGSAEEAVEAGRVGAMLQTARLPPGLRTREVVDFVRRLYRGAGATGAILETAGCAEFADRPVERLSGGQAQRLRFAMAIAGNPELLFLDEPTTGFDVDARRRFWTAIRSYAGGGRTVLFATHYMDEADEVADRIVVLQRGRVVADGSAADIKGRAGGRTVRFACAGVEAGALGALDGVVDAQVSGELVRLRSADPDATVRALVRADVPFRGLEIGGADLEDAFLALMADGVGEEAKTR